MPNEQPPPYYTIISPPIPDRFSLPNVRINKSIDLDHNAQLELLKSKLDLFKDRSRFWIEVSTIERLHYKNINQQRPFQRFHRGIEVRKVLKRIKKIAMDKELERLYKSFWNVKK